VQDPFADLQPEGQMASADPFAGLQPENGNPKMQAIMDYLKQAGQSGVDFTKGLSSSVINTPAQIANVFLPKQAQMQTFPIPQSLAGSAGQIAGDIGSFFGGGAVGKAALAGSEAIPYLGKAAQFMQGNGAMGIGKPLAGAAGSALMGAAQNPNDATGNALLGGGLSLAFDAIPGSLKGIAKAAEYVNPKKYTNELASNIKQGYQEATKEASSFYNPVREKFGNQSVFQQNLPSEYKAVDKTLLADSYDSALKKMHKNFMDEPSFGNAHDLQSQLGIEIRALQSGRPEAYTRQVIAGLQEARDALKSDMNNFLLSKDPTSAEMYNMGSRIFADKVAPYRANPVINKIASGTKRTIEPKQLQKALTAVTEGGAASENHHLAKTLGELTEKIEKGQTAKDLIPLIGGALAGGTGMLMGHGAMPGAGGAALGSIMGKFLTPSIFRLAQNPQTINLAKKASPYYNNAMKGILASILAGRGTGMNNKNVTVEFANQGEY
jgi:hypothetical protein